MDLDSDSESGDELPGSRPANSQVGADLDLRAHGTASGVSATDSASVAESGADSMQVDAPGPLASAVATYGAHARANNNALEGDRCEGVGVASLQKADCLTMEMSPTAETDEGRKSGQTRIVPHGAERALCSDVRATYSAICQNSPGSASGKKRKQALLDSYFDTDSESDECEEADLPRSLLDDPLQSGQNAEPGPAKKKKTLGQGEEQSIAS